MPTAELVSTALAAVRRYCQVSALEADGCRRPMLPAFDFGVFALLVRQSFQGEKQAGACIALFGFPA